MLINPREKGLDSLDTYLKAINIEENTRARIACFVSDLFDKIIEWEQTFHDVHKDCGADNPEGKAAKCNCYCHQGHYRHYWQPVIKTPTQSPDGTMILLDRCKYCPDMKLKIIKTKWINEKHQLVSLEYIIRGERQVLTKDEWLERKPKPLDGDLARMVKLNDKNNDSH